MSRLGAKAKDSDAQKAVAKGITSAARRPVPPAGAAGGMRPSEIISELRKVEWPGRQEVIRMTSVVITTVIILALTIGIADYVFGLGSKWIYSVLSSHITA